jgi:hypothetical protein
MSSRVRSVSGTPMSSEVEIGSLDLPEQGTWRPSDTTLERMLSVLSPVVLVSIWEVLARVGVVDTRFFPAPSNIFAVLWQMLWPSPQYSGGELWTHLSISLERIAIGSVIGVVPGVIVGLAIGMFRPVRAIVQPLVDGTFPIPKIAVLPLFIMIFGIGEECQDWAGLSDLDKLAGVPGREDVRRPRRDRRRRLCGRYPAQLARATAHSMATHLATC